MKFRGVNTLRINSETVKAALIESFTKDLIGNDLSAVRMQYHENGDVSLVFEPRREAESRKLQVINPAPDAAAPAVPSGAFGVATVSR